MAWLRCSPNWTPTADFCQIKLQPDVAKYRKFDTPFSLLIKWSHASPEHFMLQMTKALVPQIGVVRQMENFMVFGKNSSEHDKRLEQVMQHLNKASITPRSEQLAQWCS